MTKRPNKLEGQGKITVPLSANVNKRTFRHPPACWYHANVTLGRKVELLIYKWKAEKPLRKAESRAVDLPGP